MDQTNIIECGGFYFIHNFDSGNLGHVERVPTELIAPTINHKTNVAESPDYEFNLWTRPDCAGTEFENGNRTWFYFGIQAGEAGVVVRLNLINLNKQGKMYNQGMAPVTRTLPGKPQWERIRDRPVHSTDDNTFTLSFKYRTSENLKATTFFAFTYPFSFAELQISLNSIDLKMLPLPSPPAPDDIYYNRECLIYSLEGRRVDLLTITSHHGITQEREERLKNLFPENQDRPFKFLNKKVIFISARVHPGETPSSFVFNGFLNLLLTRHDPIAIQLRKLYVFKMIPFLNPDGVARGHYRTDTRGVNLNRVYLNPSLIYHPTVYASRALIRYYHFGCEKEDTFEDTKSFTSRSIQNISESAERRKSMTRFLQSSQLAFERRTLGFRMTSSKLLEVKKKKGSTTSTYKNDSKREKVGKIAGNKSLSTAKTGSIDKKEKPLIGEAANLVEQVCDMKLQEMPSQTSDTSSKHSFTNINEDSNSLLNDTVLRTCLGSNVHLSTSEELNVQGNNPLRPLRDTLKNSISLLMESSSSVTGDSSMGGKDSRLSNVKMGWCRACRLAINKLEDTMPGIANMVPGYAASMGRLESNSPTSIDEYREHQRNIFDEQEKKQQEMENEKFDKDSIFFCTNCFKRYLISEINNEEIKLSESPSCASVGVSCELPPSAAGTGDARPPTVPRPPSPIKEAGPKSPSLPRAGKKGGPPPAARPAPAAPAAPSASPPREPDSGLYLYIDLHGHASKKGIFMYGNHFDDVDSCVECMLLPRIMSLNNLHFHFSSCNFTERNMYLKDRRDGMSREGSGRVAVLKATGLVRSYTLECNYNTGRLVNVLPPTARDPPPPPHLAPPHAAPAPPKYTPHIFEEVGRSLGASILDLTGQHPNSRIPCSEHRNLSAVREWLKAHSRTMRPQLTMSRLRPKVSSPSRPPLYARSKQKVTEERKENTYLGAKPDVERRRSPAPPPPASHHDIMNVSITKFAKKNDPVKSTSRTRYLADPDPKPKTLASKRRNILAIRKPNSSKTQVGGPPGGKAKASRRSADEADVSSVSGKVSKRSFGRAWRRARPAPPPRAAPSSSSSEGCAGGWEEGAGGALAAPAPRRRPAPLADPARLKKIRLKTAAL